MNWHDGALTLAGLIGCGVAVIHGVLMHRLMARPLGELAATARLPGSTRRLLPALLQFSTFQWLLGGVALLVATRLGAEARLAIALLVGASYLYGAIFNAWGTRGRHPGWMLYAVAVALIAYGASPRA